MIEPAQVLIVGGGYAAISAYRSLRRRGGRLVAVTVVSADDHHYFHGFTGEVVAGLLPYRAARTPLTDVFRRADFVHGRVVHIDLPRQRAIVVPADGGPQRSLAYDELILVAGAIEPTASVPGLVEHGHTLREPGRFAHTLEDLRRAVADQPDRAILVVGGGFAGVEIAAAVADRGAAEGRAPIVVLAHSGERILPALGEELPSLVAEAERQLARLGVSVRYRTRLAELVEGEARFADGTRMAAAFVLGTIGMDPVRIPGLEQLPRDDDGRLVADPLLRVGDGIWTAGDAARIAHVDTGEPVPANALWAIKSGAHLGRNVACVVRGRAPRPFAYRGLGQAASFGVGRSIAELYGRPIIGPVGWVLRLAFFLRFTPTRRQAFRVAGDLMRLPLVGRYAISTELSGGR